MKKWETIREFIMITFATVIVAAAVFFFHPQRRYGGPFIRMSESDTSCSCYEAAPQLHSCFHFTIIFR